MLEEAITEWREAALAEGYAQGYAEGYAQGFAEGRAEVRAQSMAHERALFSKQATWRFGSEAGDVFAALLADEEDVERLDRVGDLVVDCANGDELLRRTRAVLAHRDGP